MTEEQKRRRTEQARLYMAQKRDNRVSGGLCAACGEKRDAEGSTRYCARCLRRARRANKRRHARIVAARKKEYAAEGIAIEPAPPLKPVSVVHVVLDASTYYSLQTLERRFQDERAERGLPPLLFRRSHVLREAIRRVRRAAPHHRRASGPRFGSFSFRIDRQTLTLVNHEAQTHHNGNRAAAVRALLRTAAAHDPDSTIAHRKTGPGDRAFLGSKREDRPQDGLLSHPRFTVAVKNDDDGW